MRSDILSCSHHRCPNYFMESIQSTKGFYGWKCQSYFHYVLGLCPYNANDMLLAGENCAVTTRGMYLVKTNSEFPFAMGRADNDARRSRWSDDELKVQLEVMKIVREEMEDGKFPQDSEYAGSKVFARILEKLEGLDHRSPKVLSINGN
jgi:Lipase